MVRIDWAFVVLVVLAISIAKWEIEHWKH